MLKTEGEALRTDGDAGIQWRGTKEGNAMEQGSPESDGKLQEAFGNTLGFPTHRRPAESRRTMDTTSSDEEIMTWFRQGEVLHLSS